MHKTRFDTLGYIAYIYNRGVDARKANLLKKALVNLDCIDAYAVLE